MVEWRGCVKRWRADMDELKPCRKCGSDMVFLESTIVGFTLLYYARCYGCNYMGDYKNRPHEAVEAWNRRADDGRRVCEISTI